ncbi:hypothetical protein [Natrarchaeobius oligotrophus]|uniref:hypothetical protein n=1 Tax=Natrarchaeobius oligotrophus TaxID=3455743 RepID=UPI000F51C50D|nr:hypothetical protein [Natrarchaeobius chitinivorans]
MEDLDKKSREMMHVLENNGGRASTTEIKRRVGIEENRSVTYRWEKLADTGYVEITRDETLTPDGVPPTIVGTITDEGWRALDEGLAASTEPDHATVDGRLDNLDQRLHALETKHDETRRDLDGLIQFINNEIVPLVAKIEDHHDKNYK